METVSARVRTAADSKNAKRQAAGFVIAGSSQAHASRSATATVTSAAATERSTDR